LCERRNKLKKNLHTGAREFVRRAYREITLILSLSLSLSLSLYGEPTLGPICKGAQASTERMFLRVPRENIYMQHTHTHTHTHMYICEKRRKRNVVPASLSPFPSASRQKRPTIEAKET
jgi:hypothetical protein